VNKNCRYLGFVALFIGLFSQMGCLDITDSCSENSTGGAGRAGGLVINEIVAQDTQGGDDWIELYVTGDRAVHLGKSPSMVLLYNMPCFLKILHQQRHLNSMSVAG